MKELEVGHVLGSKHGDARGILVECGYKWFEPLTSARRTYTTTCGPLRAIDGVFQP